MRKKLIATMAMVALCCVLVPSSAWAQQRDASTNDDGAVRALMAGEVSPFQLSADTSSPTTTIGLDRPIAFQPGSGLAQTLTYTFAINKPGKVEVRFDTANSEIPVLSLGISNGAGGEKIWESAPVIRPVAASTSFYLNRGSYDLRIVPKAQGGVFRVIHTAAEESFPDVQQGTNNDPKSASAIGFDKNYVGYLAQNDGDDYFKLTMPRKGAVRWSGSSSAGALRFNVYNKDNAALFSSWTNRESIFSREVTLDKGTYYFRIYNSNEVVSGGALANVDVGRAYGAYTFSVKPLFATSAVLSTTSMKCTGAALRPGITVKAGNTILRRGTDYTVTYANNVLPGTATATVKGKGRYAASFKLKYTITGKAPLSKASVSVKKVTYTGKALKPLTVKMGGKTLKAGRDYIAAYSNNVNAGKATVALKGKGKVSGSRKVTFAIAKRSLAGNASKVTVKKAVCKTSGKAVKPGVTVKCKGKTLKMGRDFNVAYKNNKKPGIAKAVIKGKGNYTGVKAVKFKILRP